MSSSSGGGGGGGGLAGSVRNDAPVWGPALAIASVAFANVLAAAIVYLDRDRRRLLFISNRRRAADVDADADADADAAAGSDTAAGATGAAGTGAAAARRRRSGGFWRWLALDALDPAHAAASRCLPPPLLLALHAFTVLYFGAYVLVDLLVLYLQQGWRGAYGEWCSYFTNWSITLLGVAGALAFANTLRRWRRGRAAAAAAAAREGLAARERAVELGHGGSSRTAPAAAAPAGQAAVHEAAGGSGGDLEAGGGGGGGAAKGRGLGDDDAAHAPDQHRAAPTPAPAAPPPPGRPPPPRQPPREEFDWLSASHLLVMETATAAAFCVSLWFWAGLVAVAKQEEVKAADASTYLGHAGNIGLAFVQVALARLPFASTHFLLLLWWGTLYLVFMWGYGAATGTWR